MHLTEPHDSNLFTWGVSREFTIWASRWLLRYIPDLLSFLMSASLLGFFFQGICVYTLKEECYEVYVFFCLTQLSATVTLTISKMSSPIPPIPSEHSYPWNRFLLLHPPLDFYISHSISCWWHRQRCQVSVGENCFNHHHISNGVMSVKLNLLLER